mmetsp:Transcript_42540/g.102488  ORF Transcript_42540/g.102488 Transcript_42540/m.102488 type:complete len:103 (-) Transcript_42540:46-354(-)
MRKPEEQGEGPSSVAGLRPVGCEAGSHIAPGARDRVAPEGDRGEEQKHEEHCLPAQVHAKLGEVESARRLGQQAKECMMGLGQEKVKVFGEPQEPEYLQREN